LDHSFLDHVGAQQGLWRDVAAEAKGISTRCHWTGRGRYALEVAYGTSATKPNATTVREVWRHRHGRAAAPPLVVVGYSKEAPRRAIVCGPAGEDPPVVDLDHATLSGSLRPRSPNPTATSHRPS
jgi:hypothetical protein